MQNITFPIGGTSRLHDMTIKLADFGMAGFVGSDGLLRGRCGTPGYVAPEILLAGAHEGYSMNVDMFSIGVVAYILLCGYEPFYGEDDKQLIKANKEVDYEFHAEDWEGSSLNSHTSFFPLTPPSHTPLTSLTTLTSYTSITSHISIISPLSLKVCQSWQKILSARPLLRQMKDSLPWR